MSRLHGTVREHALDARFCVCTSLMSRDAALNHERSDRSLSYTHSHTLIKSTAIYLSIFSLYAGYRSLG
jgi:hypothetical protein